MKQIFISYSRYDLDIVKPIIRQIESKVNVKCWIDWDGIESGDRFEEIIIKAIDSVDTVLFFLSDNAMASKFIKEEIQYAQNVGKRVIPIVLDGKELRGWFLFRFGSIDYINIKDKLQVNKLISNLQSWYGTEGQDVNNVRMADSDNALKQAVAKPYKSSFWSKLLRPKYLISLACVLVIGLVLGCYQIFFSSDSSQPTPQPTPQPIIPPQPPTEDVGPIYGETFIEDVKGINMKMIYVEGGTFTMGQSLEEWEEKPDNIKGERVTSQVSLDSYYIAECEVTQSQWERIMGTTIYQQRNKVDSSLPVYGVGDNYPMYYVSCEEARDFCEELSLLTGKTYLLPTRAEWQFAARGGNVGKNDKFVYSGSNSIDAVAWYEGNSNSSTHPVGKKVANQLGIYDMSGNVCEWCSGWYEDYSSSSQTNPTGPSSGDYRWACGGGYSWESWTCTASFCIGRFPSDRGSSYGFRVVCLP